jgi:hypothetical protein
MSMAAARFLNFRSQFKFRWSGISGTACGVACSLFKTGGRMKPIAIFVLVAAFSVAAIATSAKNVTAPGNTDERMGIAGPKAAAEISAKGGRPSGKRG